MKRILLASLLSSLAFAASAQTVTIQPDTAAQAPTVASTDPAVAAAPAIDSHFCLRTTGSRIAAAQNARIERDVRNGKLAAMPPRCAEIGRSYSDEELSRTGAFDVADGLRRLDPSIR